MTEVLKLPKPSICMRTRQRQRLMAACPRRNCRHYALIRPFDKDDLRMLAKVAGFFSNQAACLVPFELSPGQWQAFGNWFMSYLRLFRCHQQLWMMRAPTAICGFGVDRSHAELLLSTQPSVRSHVARLLLRPAIHKQTLSCRSGVVRRRRAHGLSPA